VQWLRNWKGMTNKEEKVVGKALRVEMDEKEGTVGAKSNHRPTEQMCPLSCCVRGQFRAAGRSFGSAPQQKKNSPSPLFSNPRHAEAVNDDNNANWGWPKTSGRRRQGGRGRGTIGSARLRLLLLLNKMPKASSFLTPAKTIEPIIIISTTQTPLGEGGTLE